jgi:hypothetical protein
MIIIFFLSLFQSLITPRERIGHCSSAYLVEAWSPADALGTVMVRVPAVKEVVDDDARQNAVLREPAQTYMLYSRVEFLQPT